MSADADGGVGGGGRRILVTGQAGFIGRHLVHALLRAGHHVGGLDKRASGIAGKCYEEFVCDLLDANATRRVVTGFAPDAVLHLAARTDLDETRDIGGYAANTTGVRHLLDAIDATPSVRRVICTSSQLVCRIGYQPASDEDYAPSTLYGESKVATERIWRGGDGAGREWALVRPTTIWGPGMNPHYLRFFRMVRDGRYFHVGRGPTHKSYGFVHNTVAQYQALLAAPRGAMHRRMFFLADYEPLALETWADAFADSLGAPPIRTMPRGAAVALARLGDLVQRAGWTRFPFTSFRLGNVLAAYQVDTTPIAALCPVLPYRWREGVDQTVDWLHAVWGAQPKEAA